MKFNNETIREAVKEWLDDDKLAESKYGDISTWDTSNVTDMSSLFLDAHEFNSPIEKWDVSNVTTMNAMFDNAYKFNQNINNWDVSNVKDMGEMFSTTEELDFNQPLDKWDVSNVTNMEHMFNGAVLFNQPIEKWNVSNVTTMHAMFNGAVSFNQPIEKWDVSRVTNMEYIFNGAVSFNQPLSKWKLKKEEFIIKINELYIKSNIHLTDIKKGYNICVFVQNIIPIVKQTEIEELLGNNVLNKPLLALKNTDIINEYNNEILSDLIINKISIILQVLIGLAKIDGEVDENEKTVIENASLKLREFYNYDEEIKLRTHLNKSDAQLAIYNALIYSSFNDILEKKLFIELMADLAFVDGEFDMAEYLNLLNVSTLIQLPIEMFVEIVFSKKLKFYDIEKEYVSDFRFYFQFSEIYFKKGYGKALSALVP